MDASWIRDLCLSFPSVTEHVIWGNDLTFKVAGKMFAHAVLEPAPVWLSFKASPENFYELIERPGIIPAPYQRESRVFLGSLATMMSYGKKASWSETSPPRESVNRHPESMGLAISSF